MSIGLGLALNLIRRKGDTAVRLGLISEHDFMRGADPKVLYDISGNKWHGQLGGTSTATSTDPTWVAGTGGLSFDGIDDYVIHQSGPTGERTIIVVAKGPVTPTTSSYPEIGTFGKTLMYYSQNGLSINVLHRLSSGGNGSGGYMPIAQGSTNVFVSRVGATQAFLGLNTNPVVATVSSTGFDYLSTMEYGRTFGSRQGTLQPVNMVMYYAMIYDRALSNEEYLQTYNYIKEKLQARNVILP